MNETVDEKTLFVGSPSLMVRFGTFALCGLAIIASVLFGLLFNTLLMIPGALILIYAIGAGLRVKRRVYEVTTERIRKTVGIMSRRLDEIEHYRVQDIVLLEPFWQRLFGLGTLRITTMDNSHPELVIEAIRGARDLREQLRHSVEAARDRKRVRLTEFDRSS
jgi:uncharacterized membrane protein YdbT with pleckstrin-like domain